MTVNHLDNVCIVQKYNDSDKVLECREQFEESRKAIVTACNSHEELVEALRIIYKRFAEIDPHLNPEEKSVMEIAKEALRKAGAL